MISPIPAYFRVDVGFAPLPPPWFHALREIEIETAIGRASMFRLHFDLSRNPLGDFDALAVDLFVPLMPITIEISAGPGVPLTVVNGYVADGRLGVSNRPGTSTYEVVGMDALGTQMAQTDQPFPWTNMSDDQIAAAIFARNGLTPLTMPAPPLRNEPETSTVQRGTDAAFLQQLAARNGFALYVQPEPVSGRDNRAFSPAPVAAAAAAGRVVDRLRRPDQSRRLLRRQRHAGRRPARPG